MVMPEWFPEFYTKIRSVIADSFGDNVRVCSENEFLPSALPCVTILELSSIPVLWDSASESSYYDVEVRIRVFSNDKSGKIRNARAIMQTICTAAQSMNFRCTSQSCLSDLYQFSVFRITANLVARIGADGNIYRR